MSQPQTKYVDGFVLVVPKKNVAAYRKMARDAAKIWMNHGALAYRECMLDDATPPFVELPFPLMTKAKPSDTVWFSYIEYMSKAHRNQVNKKVMKEMEERYPDHSMKDMPFDMKRMSFGGFRVEVGT